MEKRATVWDILAFLPLLVWLGINYKFTTKGLGSNGGNIRITPRGGDDLPQLQFSRDDFSIKSSVPGDSRAYFRAELPEPGVVEVTDIYRGGLPKGSGGVFLARTLQGHGVSPFKQLVFKNIENQPTKEAFRLGIAPAESVLGKTARNALQEWLFSS